MQRVFISAGKAPCRYCGESITVNALSTHIAQKHPRPVRKIQRPTLVKKAEGLAGKS